MLPLKETVKKETVTERQRRDTEGSGMHLTNTMVWPHTAGIQ